MFDPILSIAVVAYVATLAFLYFVVLDRPERHANEHSRGERSATQR